MLAEGLIAAVKELARDGADRHPHGRHQRRAGQGDARATAASTSRRPTRWARPREQGRRPREVTEPGSHGCSDRLLDTRLLVQGLTGREGTFHAKQAAAYGTTVVGGVTPGKGGTTHEGWPIFNTVAEAVEKTGANASVIFVPPPGAADAVMEAADAGIAAGRLHHRRHPDARHDEGVRLPAGASRRALIGPNCPGLISAGHGKAGIIPGHICKRGRVGIVSKSGTLTYEAIHQLTRLGLGQTTCIGIGGDPLIGTIFIDALKLFADDAETEAVVMIGEIGGTAEQDAADWIKAQLQEAGRRLHRRPDGAPGPPDGPRRRDHLGRQGHRRREDGRARRRPASAWSRAPPTSGAAIARRASAADRVVRHPASRARMGDHPGRPQARPGAPVAKIILIVAYERVGISGPRCRALRGPLRGPPHLMSPPDALAEAGQPAHRHAGAVVNDFSIQVATVNGSGSQTANLVLLRSIFQMGVPVSGKNLFPSNIAGLPTWFTIRANKHGYIGAQEGNRLPRRDEPGDGARGRR